MLGLSTGPCSVVGCGAPVIPVLGLAFTGLTSGTLTLLARVSRVATTLVLVGLTVGVLYLAWRAGTDTRARAEVVRRASRSGGLRSPLSVAVVSATDVLQEWSVRRCVRLTSRSRFAACIAGAGVGFGRAPG